MFKKHKSPKMGIKGKQQQERYRAFYMFHKPGGSNAIKGPKIPCQLGKYSRGIADRIARVSHHSLHGVSRWLNGVTRSVRQLHIHTETTEARFSQGKYTE